jgi:hypothetical protein
LLPTPGNLLKNNVTVNVINYQAYVVRPGFEPLTFKERKRRIDLADLRPVLKKVC